MVNTWDGHVSWQLPTLASRGGGWGQGVQDSPLITFLFVKREAAQFILRWWLLGTPAHPVLSLEQVYPGDQVASALASALQMLQSGMQCTDRAMQVLQKVSIPIPDSDLGR